MLGQKGHQAVIAECQIATGMKSESREQLPRTNNLWGLLSNDLIYREITFNASHTE